MKNKEASIADLLEETDKKFYLLPFLLGAFLWIFGVALVYVIWDDPARIRSAWWGFAIVLLVYGISTGQFPNS